MGRREKGKSAMTDIVTVSIACASDTEARIIARALVEDRLAACVQSQPLTSTYLWAEAIETTAEIMLTAKTRADKLIALEARVRSLHSYAVPEILAVPVVWVHEPYAQWLNDVLGPDE
jgi:periplasmic divalent cation tolerance protein